MRLICKFIGGENETRRLINTRFREGIGKTQEGEAIYISKKENIDFAPLIELCEEYIEELIMEGSAYNYENKAFETAVECIYGPQVWDWYEENGFG